MSGDPGRLIFFDSHPDPMWIFDPATLQILDANDAALQLLGHSRAVLLSMSIAELRPPEDLPSLRAALTQVGPGHHPGGTWRLRRRNGSLIHAELRWHRITLEGCEAMLASVRDVTHTVALEQEREALLERERQARREAEASARHFQGLFETAPGKFLVLRPPDHEIVAVSDAYLEATMTRRDVLKGRKLFEAFPSAPDDPQGDGVRQLRASLARVLRSGQTDVMAVQRYPIPRPPERGGGFEERFWSSINTPLKAADGSIAFIIHRVEDVTDLVRAAHADPTAPPQALEHAHLAQEVLLRAQELKRANLRLQEQEANLRTAQRLLGLGLWGLDERTGALRWSDNVHEMYGVAPGAPGTNLNTYLDLVHPEDHEALRTAYLDFRRSGRSSFEFAHRVQRADGSVMRVRGIGERTDTVDGPMLTGVVQDVTRQAQAEARLEEAMRLLRIAGRTARLGGWRADLAAGHIVWSPETAAIHDEPEGTVPKLARALDYFISEDRERGRAVFLRCARTGESFDEVLRIVSARGRQVWVRSIGEAQRDADGRIVAVQGAFQDITETVEAQQRSEALSTRLRQTLESISDAFFTLDDAWRFTFLNGQAERLLDRSADALIGRVVWDEFPASANTEFERGYRHAARARETVRFVEFYAPLDRWFEVTAYPAHEGLAVYFRDVTRQRAVDEHLRLLEAAVARQNDLLLIADARPDAHWPQVVYANRAFTRLTGFDAQAAIGRAPLLLDAPDANADAALRVRAALRQGRPLRTELQAPTQDGKGVWLDVDLSPMTDLDGRCTHWVCIGRDLSARRRAEHQVALTEERFQRIARATNDVIWDWDFAADTLWWNEGLLTLFGHDPARLDPGPAAWASLIHPEDRDWVLQSFQKALDDGDEQWSQEYRFLRADGSAAAVIDRGFVMRDAQGKATRAIGSLIDISERRALDERLRQSQKLEAIGQLTGGVAHDFNNLLTVILGNAELLREQLSTQPQLARLAEMTANAAERGAELTNRLLAFARQQALQPQAVDVNTLIAGIGGLLRRTLSESITIEFLPAPELWTTEVDPGQLESALLNIVLNARDAMVDGGSLTIETANATLDADYAAQQPEVRPGDYVLVSVSDTGAGMPTEVAARAFEPFFTTKDVGKGSGLGLSMVYGFVKQSGGHARLYSEPGEGTTVKLYFPRAGVPTAMAPPEEAATRTAGGNEHILIVEDDPLVRAHLEAQLRALGYRVSAAEHGPAALRYLRDTPDVDLLLTDIVMPGCMNGREVAEAALHLRPRLKVLFTSGYTDNAIAHHGRLDPGVHLLNKPYRRQELADKVRRALDGTLPR